jgi:acyl carrier protein
MRFILMLTIVIALGAGPSRAAVAVSCAEADAHVQEILVEILAVDRSRIVPSATLRELGEDLTDSADISIAIERLFQVELQDEDYDNVVSVLDLQKLVRRLSACR